MKCRGKAWTFGSNINTDAILPTQYMNLRDPSELAQHCMENENPRFVKESMKGDIMVAGNNFGCGSSREHAPISIKGKGVCCVIAKTFAICWVISFSIRSGISSLSEATTIPRSLPP